MHKEFEEYQAFTTPAQLHKAINTLRGLVAGITTDSKASQTEMAELIHWCELHSHLRNRHPFSEILPVVEAACEDNVLTEDESKDILWLCGNFVDDAGYYDQITSSIQFLAGLIHGVMADGTLLDTEIKAIRSWIQTNDYLAGVYPYDEINSLLSVILEDKVITSDERDQLMAFFSNLIEFQDSLNLNANEFESLRNRCKISGICATCPTIHFTNHTFCFTGEFQRGKRSDLERTVSELGGMCRSSVSKKTNYLVVGNLGNPCWAFACYGRKIEEAMALRKEGHSVIIVNETDFWDAADDVLAGITD